MNRFGAFAVHLGISLVIFIIIGYLILFHWYPDFFFASDGGWQGIRLIAMVDLVLGPVLTLVVYKKGKPSLKFDLTCIGLLQAVCLAAGVWVVHGERPIAMVFADGSFHSMTQDDYLQVSQPVPDLARFPGSPPHWISVRLPEDPVAQSAVRRQAYQSATPIRALADFYQPFETSHIDVERDGLTEQELTGRDHLTPFLNDFLQKNGGELGDYRFLPFGTRYALALMAFRKKDGFLGFLAVPGGLMVPAPAAQEHPAEHEP